VARLLANLAKVGGTTTGNSVYYGDKTMFLMEGIFDSLIDATNNSRHVLGFKSYLFGMKLWLMARNSKV
jgi:hypothetical protein